MGEIGSPASFGVRIRNFARPTFGGTIVLPASLVIMNFLHQTSLGIGVLGVLVIVFGVACGVARLVRAELRAACGKDIEGDHKRLRHALGYYLLLGLEFMIASDIIDTLIRPTLQDLGALGAIVLIRTIISFSLNAELKSEQPKPITP